jgi:hypothetical protein
VDRLDRSLIGSFSVHNSILDPGYSNYWKKGAENEQMSKTYLLCERCYLNVIIIAESHGCAKNIPMVG